MFIKLHSHTEMNIHKQEAAGPVSPARVNAPSEHAGEATPMFSHTARDDHHFSPRPHPYTLVSRLLLACLPDTNGKEKYSSALVVIKGQ